MILAQSAASNDDLEELILSCRYGDLEDVREFVRRFGATPLDDFVDENGNSCLHMAAANGHEGQLCYFFFLSESCMSRISLLTFVCIRVCVCVCVYEV
jgi:ankyrin repeat protein